MIDSTVLKNVVWEYERQCKVKNCKPTYEGLSRELNISTQTISNAIHERFNGKPYTEHPHTTRVIDNADFQILQRLFDSREDLSV